MHGFDGKGGKLTGCFGLFVRVVTSDSSGERTKRFAAKLNRCVGDDFVFGIFDVLLAIGVVATRLIGGDDLTDEVRLMSGLGDGMFDESFGIRSE